MGMRLEQESRVLASIARDYGLITYCMSSFWDSIKPFCLGMESGGERLNLWHHIDYQKQRRLQHFWGSPKPRRPLWPSCLHTRLLACPGVSRYTTDVFL